MSEFVHWYHGTTSNAASRICKSGFRKGETFFALSEELAYYFAWERGTLRRLHTIPCLTCLVLRIPSEREKCFREHYVQQTVGTDGSRHVDIGDAQEIILSTEGADLLNQLIADGEVTISRRIIYHPAKGVYDGRRLQ